MVRFAGLFLLLVPCSIMDILWMEIPVYYVGILLLTAGGYNLITGEISGLQMLMGAFLGAIFFLIGKYTKEQLGYGDAWIITALGILMGISGQLSIVLLAFILAGVLSTVLLLIKRKKGTYQIPFVPFLLFSSLLMIGEL